MGGPNWQQVDAFARRLIGHPFFEGDLQRKLRSHPLFHGHDTFDDDHDIRPGADVARRRSWASRQAVKRRRLPRGTV